MLSAVPKINMPKGAKGRKMKGGAVVGEQFDGMIAAVPENMPTDPVECVAPAILQKLMRHASIQTTMGYYIDLDVDEMADELWANHGPATGKSPAAGNTFGNNGPVSAKNAESPATVTDCEASTYISEGDGGRTRNHRIDRAVKSSPNARDHP